MEGEEFFFFSPSISEKLSWGPPAALPYSTALPALTTWNAPADAAPGSDFSPALSKKKKRRRDPAGEPTSKPAVEQIRGRRKGDLPSLE